MVNSNFDPNSNPSYSPISLSVRAGEGGELMGENAGGYPVPDIPPGTGWTITVKAYQNLVLRQDTGGHDVEREYLVAKGSSPDPVTVVAGMNTVQTIELKPENFSSEEWASLNGLFVWDITLPVGTAAANMSLVYLDKPNGLTSTSTVSYNLLESSAGRTELQVGTYNLFITFEKDGLNAGFYDWVYIYPGLPSPALLNFSDQDVAGQKDVDLTFGNTVMLVGTAGIDGLDTGDNLRIHLDSITGSNVIVPDSIPLKVSAYIDLSNEGSIIQTATVDSDGRWFLDLPLTGTGNKATVGQPVYLKLAIASGAYGNPAASTLISPLPKNGQQVDPQVNPLVLEFAKGADITAPIVLHGGETAAPLATTLESGTLIWDSTTDPISFPDPTSNVLGPVTGGVLALPTTFTTDGETIIWYYKTVGNSVTMSLRKVPVYTPVIDTLKPVYVTPFSGLENATLLPSNGVAIGMAKGSNTEKFEAFLSSDDEISAVPNVVLIDENTGKLTLKNSDVIKVLLTITDSTNPDYDRITHRAFSDPITVSSLSSESPIQVDFDSGIPVKADVDFTLKLDPADGELSWAADDSLTVSVSDDLGYTPSSYQWYSDGVAVGTGSEITLNAQSFALGSHSVAVTIKNTAGESYSSIARFKVGK
jgi:hypothetical protein